MSSSTSLILALFVAAFLVFVFRFYNREGASSIANPSFLLAGLTVLLAFCFLGLGVLGRLPEYGIIIFGFTGLALLVLSVARMFRI